MKDPPKDYPYPPFDAVGQLEMVREKLVNGNYTNEISWQTDFYQITALAHNGHFTLYPDGLVRAFDYGRPVGLVSVANYSGGQPVIKILRKLAPPPYPNTLCCGCHLSRLRRSDCALEDVQGGDDGSQVVVQINGMDASQYVQNMANSASMNQDPDAGYNMMFYSRVHQLSGIPEGWFQSGGRHR